MAFSLTNGLLAGLLLAAFLALCDGLFQTTTFQVLIDVGYVPALANLPSILELGIHLLLSIVVTAIFAYFYPVRRNVLRYVSLWVLFFFLIFFPFSWASGQPVSIAACLIWLLGHLLYSLFLTFQVERYS